MMSDSSSMTWSAHVRIIFQLYHLPDPLLLLDSTPWPKQRWKEDTKIAVLIHHKAIWRKLAAKNFKLQYLNVQCTGLSARPHPVLAWVLTTQDVVIVRPHIQMLAGDLSKFRYVKNMSDFLKIGENTKDKLGLSCSKLSSRLASYENHLPVSLSSCEFIILFLSSSREVVFL